MKPKEPAGYPERPKVQRKKFAELGSRPSDIEPPFASSSHQLLRMLISRSWKKKKFVGKRVHATSTRRTRKAENQTKAPW